jgi:hypothetical protein
MKLRSFLGLEQLELREVPSVVSTAPDNPSVHEQVTLNIAVSKSVPSVALALSTGGSPGTDSGSITPDVRLRRVVQDSANPTLDANSVPTVNQPLASVTQKGRED